MGLGTLKDCKFKNNLKAVWGEGDIGKFKTQFLEFILSDLKYLKDKTFKICGRDYTLYC